MKDRCNCGKKATSEFLIRKKKVAWTIKVCDNCKPKNNRNLIEL